MKDKEAYTPEETAQIARDLSRLDGDLSTIEYCQRAEGMKLVDRRRIVAERQGFVRSSYESVPQNVRNAIGDLDGRIKSGLSLRI